MDAKMEKVYVALGNDLQDGFKTLDWTLRKWKSSPVSIVILHVAYNISQDFVYTPFGKLPASSVSDEKLEVLKKNEQEKMEKLLTKYIAFCGKVKAEIMKVEKPDEPIHKVIVDLISRHKITKLVMGITFMKFSSWKSKNAISGSFYIYQHKPTFCEFFIICGGKLVFLKGENEQAFMNDDQEVTFAKKTNFKSWMGRMFNENTKSLGRNSHRLSGPSRNLRSLNSQDQWEIHVQEIENYFEYLSSLNLDEEIHEEDNDILEISSEPDVLENADSTMSVAVRMESMRSKISEAQKTIQLKREEAKANAERCAKAEWAIRFCNSQVEELEAKVNEEVSNQIEIKKNIDAKKERIQEITRDVEESKSGLRSLVELQSELSNKLQISTSARSHMEAQLEKAVVSRAEMVRKIEELRRQRDVLQRRIEFCREKDAIGMVTKLSELSCGCREYTAEDIRLATDGFSESLRLKSGGDWINVYRGRIGHATVAIKMLNSNNGLSQEDFLAKVKLLNNIRHPHLVAMMGFCSELKCIIFEYMHNGSLKDILFCSQRNHAKRNRSLRWQHRIRVAHDVCSGLAFLHLTQPRPIIHGHLNPSNILLDCHLLAKVSGYGLNPSYGENDVRPDIHAFGVLLLHLLTGRNWAGLVEEAMTMDRTAVARVLDEMAGQWPLDLAEELVGIAMRCLCVNRETNTDLTLEKIMEELHDIKKKADDLVAKGECEVVVNGAVDKEDSSEVPSIFICPIYKDIMKNPYVAADGFSYELEAIEEWLRMGHDTSPMTNLRLKQKFLTPNHTLRFLIEEWHNKKSTVPR